MEPTGKLTYPTVPYNFSTVYIGDSYIAGYGTVDTTTSYSTNSFQQYDIAIQLMYLMGLPDINQVAIPGTGMVTVNSFSQGPFSVFWPAALTAINSFRPIGLIIVGSSFNDTGGTALQTAATNLFLALRTAYPLVPIVVIGCNSGGSVSLSYAQAVESSTYAAYQARVTAGDKNIYFVQNANNSAGQWITGTGNIGATTGTGNADYDIYTDGVHPSIYGGHPKIARGIDAAMAGIVNAIP